MSLLDQFNLAVVWDNLYRFARVARLNGISEACRRAKRRLEEGNFGKHFFDNTQDLSFDAGLNDPALPLFLPLPPQIPDVSIIIPVHNQWAYTYNCLSVLFNACSKYSYEVILADDNSSDETVHAARLIENLIVLRNEKNCGFVLNCNNAAKRARGRYIYFLNNDTKCLPGAIDKLVEVLDDDPKAGIVGSKLVYPDGRLQEAGGIIWANGEGWNYGRFQDPSRPEFCYRRQTDYVSGASLMIRRDLWERIDGFDERFVPAYCEDSDLCFSARKAGFQVVFQPESIVIHYEGISHGTSTDGGYKKYQIKNAQTLFYKWQDILQRDHFVGPADLFKARDHSRGRQTVLVIDHYVPHYDRDAGSRTIWAFICSLVDNGNNVKFIGDNFYSHQPYTNYLQRMGVEVLHGSWYAEHWMDWLKDNGKSIDVVLLSRPHVTKRYLKAIQRFTKARILYYCHDLHFLREERRLKIPGERPGSRSVKVIRQEEFNLMRQMDTVLHCSPEEIEIIKQGIPGKDVRYVPPYTIDPFEMPYDPAKRKGILFVGGFAHPPNVDAVLWFAKEIFPDIRAKYPEIIFHIAGSNPPGMINDLAGPGIEIHADIDDIALRTLYCSVRLAVVPLRYGAGVKGKTVEAMGFGVPVVSAQCGLEGLPEEMGKAAILWGNMNEEIVSTIVSAYNDLTLLIETSAKGLESSHRWFSLAGMRQNWKTIIDEQMVLHSIGGCQTRSQFEELLSSKPFTEITKIEEAFLVENKSNDSFTVDGFCIPCGKRSSFRVDKIYSCKKNGDLWIPNWRERLVCPYCLMNNRQRLIAAIVSQYLKSRNTTPINVYFMEQITPIYNWAKKTFSQHSIIGSEYLGPELDSGEFVKGIRHEDLKNLSFEDNSIDLIVSNDVFEHVSDSCLAFIECARVLRPGGIMLFTVPFYSENDSSVTRAIMKGKEIVHLLPPVLHGNPVSAKGALVFTDFGWDLLSRIKENGFNDVYLEIYASMVFGHLGSDQFLFVAKK